MNKWLAWGATVLIRALSIVEDHGLCFEFGIRVRRQV